MSGPRIVNVLDSNGRVHLGFVFSDGTSQGTELLIPTVDSQNNSVSWKHENGRYGKNFCEIGENTTILGQEEREAFEHKTTEEFVGMTDAEIEVKTQEKKHHHKG